MPSWKENKGSPEFNFEIKDYQAQYQCNCIRSDYGYIVHPDPVNQPDGDAGRKYSEHTK